MQAGTLYQFSVENTAFECNCYANLFKEAAIDRVCMVEGEDGHNAFNVRPVIVFSDREGVKIILLDLICQQEQLNEGWFKHIQNAPETTTTLTISA